MQASCLNQAIQVAGLRPRLQALAGGRWPQILLRLGWPDGEVPVSPRRSVNDVMETTSG